MTKNTVFALHAQGDGAKMVRDGSEESIKAVMAERFKAARAMNGIGQTEAAKRMGYVNATQLSLIEEGRGQRVCPMWTLRAASRVYGVSTDYLLGESNEPERDPRLAERQSVMRHIHFMIAQHSEVMVTRMNAYLTTGAPAVITSRRLLREAKAVMEAVQRMHDLNKTAFEEDLRGANTVLRTMDALQSAVSEVEGMLDRYDRSGEVLLQQAQERIGKNYPLFDQPDAEPKLI